MKLEIQSITPEMAQQYLKKNLSNNRNLRQNVVLKYARMMRKGEWKLTHEGIAIDTNNKLIDGQHRLAAIVESGCTIEMLVATEVPATTCTVINTGASRDLRDQLTLMYPDKRYSNNHIISFVRHIFQYKYHYSKDYKVTANEVSQFLESYPNICRYIVTLTSGRRSIKHGGYLAGIVAAMANGVTEEAIQSFNECVAVGAVNSSNVCKFEYKSANNFRRWYDSPNRQNHGSVGSVQMIEHTESSIYCFSAKKCHTELCEKYNLTDENLRKLDDRLSNS